MRDETTTTTNGRTDENLREAQRLSSYWAEDCRRMIAHVADPAMPEWSREAAEVNAATFATRAAHYARMAGLIPTLEPCPTCGCMVPIAPRADDPDYIETDCTTCVEDEIHALTLRPYGPGKYATMLDAYVHGLSLDGCDEEDGENGYGGTWYGLLRRFHVDGPFSDVSGSADLTEDEIAFLRLHAHGGAILSEDSQGFVTVTYYRTADERNAAWSEIVDDASQYATDEDGGRA